MRMEDRIRDRIIKNAFLSIFIYGLPVVLMFLTFSITGQRPWEKKQKEKEKVRTEKTNSPSQND
jgi:hypothetical protein